MIDHQGAVLGGGASAPVDGFGQAGGLPAVPIVLGVVGHLAVGGDGGRAVFERLVKLFGQFEGDGTGTPRVLLSGLAEGADQLAARAALECGFRVRAVLPFPRDAYRASTSFRSDESRRKLDEFLDDPRVEWFVVPLPPPGPGEAAAEPDWSRVATEQHDPATRELRHRCYANGGGYIVRRCHALVALWDGEPPDPEKPSGTAEQVLFKLVGQAPRLYPGTDAEPLGFRGERGLVLWVHSPRAGGSTGGPQGRPAGSLTLLTPKDEEGPEAGPGPVGPIEERQEWDARIVRFSAPEAWNDLIGRPVGPWERFRGRVRTSFGGRPKGPAKERAELDQFRELCQSVRDFNVDVAEEHTARAIGGRLEGAAGFDIPAFGDRHRAWYGRLCRVREAAAAVSGRLRPQHDLVYQGVFYAIAASALCFHMYAHKFVIDEKVHPIHTGHAVVWLGGFVLCLVLASVLVLGDWWFRLDARRLDARALGEGLRVRRAWAKAGIARSVADSYAGQLRGEFSWVRHALLHVCPPPRYWADEFDGLATDQQLGLLGEVRADWVRGQVHQFEKSHREQHQAATLLRRVGFVAALAGWGLALALLFTGRGPEAHAPGAPAEEGAGHPSGPAYPSHDVIILSSLLVIGGGLLIAYVERQGFEELARQYERMAAVFLNGDHELARRLARRDVEGARRVIEELGREAITEQAEWYMLRRARALELHIG